VGWDGVDRDATYTTPMYHHNPIQPHTIAVWTDDGPHPLPLDRRRQAVKKYG
jgi:hypothetical protein